MAEVVVVVGVVVQIVVQAVVVAVHPLPAVVVVHSNGQKQQDEAMGLVAVEAVVPTPVGLVVVVAVAVEGALLAGTGGSFVAGKLGGKRAFPVVAVVMMLVDGMG